MSTAGADSTVFERCADAWQAFRDGEHFRFGDVVDGLTPMLWHTAMGLGANNDQAEDALQTAWIQLLRYQHTIDEPRALARWMMVTVQREVVKLRKQEQRCSPVDTLDPVTEAAYPAVEGPESDVVARDTADRVWIAVRRLPEKCQVLLRALAAADVPDYAAVAETLGVPRGSIGPTRGRCIEKLRALLQPAKAGATS